MKIKRRQFINLSLIAGGGLILGINTSCSHPKQQKSSEHIDSGNKYLFNPFIEISEDGRIILYAPVPEIGQGIRTALPMILAEELDADWEDIVVQQAVAADGYGNMSAAGSTSVSRFYQPLRKAGALVREMLITAAAQKWGVPNSQLKTDKSLVINTNNGETISYFELAEFAAELPVPNNVMLKDVADFKIIGQARKSVDLLDIVTGKATYGIDSKLDNMKFVAIERCPVRGGTLVDFDATKTLAVPGVIDIIEIKAYAPIPYAEVLPGVAVIAMNTSAALKGKELLEVNWDKGETAKENDDYYNQQYEEIKSSPAEVKLRKTEHFSSAMQANDKTLEFDYKIPFWAHYCMEPMNFTAHFKADKCILKGPNQRPQLIQDLVSQIYKIPLEKVEVMSTLSGGGFGRRLAVDYALEALIVSKQTGFPVQVIWSREDDVLHDYFRSISYHHFKIGLKENKLNAWYHHLMTKPIGDGPIYEVQGAADLPFDIPHINIGYSQFPTGIRIGSWRSVAHTFNSFVVNNTITEIALELNKDPLDFYLELIGDRDDTTVNLPLRGYRGEVYCNLNRLKAVLEKAAELADWHIRRDDNTALGIACVFFKTSYAAHVVEVSRSQGKIKLDKITAVLDCGRVINPLGVKAQMEGSISDAITIALKSNITIENGQPREINFDTHQITRISDMPALQLHVMESTDPPAGAGEPPFPSVAPAIANAIFRLTGEKIRSLPISI